MSHVFGETVTLLFPWLCGCFSVVFSGFICFPSSGHDFSWKSRFFSERKNLRERRKNKITSCPTLRPRHKRKEGEDESSLAHIRSLFGGTNFGFAFVGEPDINRGLLFSKTHSDEWRGQNVVAVRLGNGHWKLFPPKRSLYIHSFPTKKWCLFGKNIYLQVARHFRILAETIEA